MPFAAHEIENKRFVLALRGYQTDEVEAFLRAVAADYRALLAGTASAAAPAADRPPDSEPPPEFVQRRIERWAGEAASALALEVDWILQDARDYAAAIRREAQERADALLRSAEEEIARQRRELEELRTRRDAAGDAPPRAASG